jgi:heme/copper-type cytochrome/quinol oxidase subunit 2
MDWKFWTMIAGAVVAFVMFLFLMSAALCSKRGDDAMRKWRSNSPLE